LYLLVNLGEVSLLWMGKTRDHFKKIRNTKGTFHTKMSTIKDRNDMYLTEPENIKKRWQEYTEELYKKDFHSVIFQDLNSWAGIPSSPLALFIVMLSKAHLSSHSRMSGSRWVFTPSWLSGLWKSFLYNSSVYSCHLFLIFSGSVRYISFQSFRVWFQKWNGWCIIILFLIFDFWGNCHTILNSSSTALRFANRVQGFHFLTILSTLTVLCFCFFLIVAIWVWVGSSL